MRDPEKPKDGTLFLRCVNGAVVTDTVKRMLVGRNRHGVMQFAVVTAAGGHRDVHQDEGGGWVDGADHLTGRLGAHATPEPLRQ